MDLTGFPLVAMRGHDYLLMIHDRFSKLMHLLLTTTRPTVEDVTNLFFQHVFIFHGVPQTIISKKDVWFVNRFTIRFGRAQVPDQQWPTPVTLKPMGKPSELTGRWKRCCANMYVIKCTIGIFNYPPWSLPTTRQSKPQSVSLHSTWCSDEIRSARMKSHWLQVLPRLMNGEPHGTPTFGRVSQPYIVLNNVWGLSQTIQGGRNLNSRSTISFSCQQMI